MKKSRIWQAIVPGTQKKPQDTLPPWHGATKQPPAVPLPAVPLPGPNVTPEPTEKIKGLAGNCSRHTNQATTLQIRKTPWHGVTKQPPAAPVPGPNVTPEPNEKIKGLAGASTVPGTETKPQDTLQIRKTPWHGVTKQPPAVPLPGPNVTPEPNEKIKGLAGNCSRHTNQATRHPSNQENTLARRDETASCRPSARAKRHS